MLLPIKEKPFQGQSSTQIEGSNSKHLNIVVHKTTRNLTWHKLYLEKQTVMCDSSNPKKNLHIQWT